MKKAIRVILVLAILFASVGCNKAKETVEAVPVAETETAIETKVVEEAETEEVEAFTTLTFPSADGLDVTADLYLCENSKKWIIGFHQAGVSRGEYREIGKLLVEQGYNLLAVDLRSGKSIINVVNETNVKAKELGLTGTRELDYQDMVAAVKYVEETYAPEYVIAMGSSYSAAMSLILGKENDAVDAIVSFSPGEYVILNEKSVAENIIGLSKPVLIASGANEVDTWKPLIEGIASENKVFDIPPVGGTHGVRCLWPSVKGNEHYWGILKDFFASLLTRTRIWDGD